MAALPEDPGQVTQGIAVVIDQEDCESLWSEVPSRLVQARRSREVEQGRTGPELDRERRTAILAGAGGGQLAAVGLDHRPADRQAEPEAAVTPLLSGPSARTR